MYYYVYILQSIPSPDKTYIGFTTDLENRLKKHNEDEYGLTRFIRTKTEWTLCISKQHKSMHTWEVMTSRMLFCKLNKLDFIFYNL